MVRGLFDWTDGESTSKHLADAKSKPELDRREVKVNVCGIKVLGRVVLRGFMVEGRRY